MKATFAAISDLMRAIVEEGADSDPVAECEAKLVVLLSRARTMRRTEEALVHLGATLAAEREGCHRVTVYRRVKKLREMAKHATP